MLIIADVRMPKAAKNRLETLGEILWMETQPSTYFAIAAHPDIFYCQIGATIVAAPNAPRRITEKLIDNNISLITGCHEIGSQHPETTFYNAVFTKSLFIHNTKLSDDALHSFTASREIVFTSQGYTRCNLIPLTETSFLTSDRNIEKALLKRNMETLFVEPKEILLPGVNHGFIGGCCGIFDKKLIVIGSFDRHSQGKMIRYFIENQEIEIIELYEGALWDGGGILFFLE
ncbi:MAG: hypothetical protein LBH92_00520 [Bacteroidales bacterium]|jgi:hypothetical protein|nr:hypothetical protein [Bacteroidales bacterium]